MVQMNDKQPFQMMDLAMIVFDSAIFMKWMNELNIKKQIGLFRPTICCSIWSISKSSTFDQFKLLSDASCARIPIAK